MKQYNSETMISIPEARALLRSKFVSSAPGRMRLQVVDVTAGNSQGYDFALMRTIWRTIDYGPCSVTDWQYDRAHDVVLSTTTAYDSAAKNCIGGIGAYRQVFDRQDFLAALALIHGTTDTCVSVQINGEKE